MSYLDYISQKEFLKQSISKNTYCIVKKMFERKRLLIYRSRIDTIKWSCNLCLNIKYLYIIRGFWVFVFFKSYRNQICVDILCVKNI